MSWAQIEKKHREKYNRSFVLCREEEERNFLINSILDAFPFIRREDAERTFDYFCRSNMYPAARELFLSRIKEQLGKEITQNYVNRYNLY